ncbi:MAG: Flp pilus assembly protein CpaB [Caulobacteraceae bacterium]
MPLRTIATFAIAIVLGLIAVVLINVYMGSAKKPQVAQVSGAGNPVVVAAVPIGRGTPIQPALLKVVNFPAGSTPADGFTSTAVFSGGKDTQRIAMSNIAANAPVLSNNLTPPGAKLDMATEIDPGMQAVTLRTNDVAGVGGFVLPNDRVDILLSRQVGENKKLAVTQIIAQNIRVLGVDQQDDTAQNKPIVVKAITLEVTPEQAQSITLAQSVGEVSLALRHVEDSAPIGRLATTAVVFGFTAPQPLAHRRAGPRLPVVHVTRATDTTEYQLSAR